MHVLLLEDEALIAMALEMFAEEEGAAKVVVAANLADAARNEGADQFFDLAIVDVALPDGDSKGVAAALAEKGTRILFHSGHADETMLSSLFPGAAFCQKPSTPGTMRAAIRRLCARPPTPGGRAIAA